MVPIALLKRADGVEVSTRTGPVLPQAVPTSFRELEQEFDEQHGCRASFVWSPDTFAIEIRIVSPLDEYDDMVKLASRAFAAQKVLARFIASPNDLARSELADTEVEGIGLFVYHPERATWQADWRPSQSSKWTRLWKRSPTCKLYVDPLAGRPDPTFVRQAREFANRFREIDNASRTAIADELLETYNEGWRQNGPVLSRESFSRMLRVESMTWARHSEQPCAIYVTGKADLFWGHVVDVYYNPDYSVRSAGLYG